MHRCALGVFDAVRGLIVSLMLVGIVFNVERESLQALLPEGYVVDQAVQPTVIFEAMHLRNLPWLNGRGG